MTLARHVHVSGNIKDVQVFQVLINHHVSISFLLSLASLGVQLFIFRAISRKRHMGPGISIGNWGMKWRAVNIKL